MTETAPIGRAIHVVVLGNTDREHPIEDAIADAAMDAGKAHGFDVLVASGPYWEGGDERDLKIAELTADRDRARDVAVALEQELAEVRERLADVVRILTRPPRPRSPVERIDHAVSVGRAALAAPESA